MVEPLGLVLPGYQSRVQGFYDDKNESYGLQLYWEKPVAGQPNDTFEDLFVFSQINSGFLGAYDYRFDSYVVQNNELFGMRDGETYILDKGYIINGSPVNFEVLQACSSAEYRQFTKEFMFINVNSTEKPTRLEFYDPEERLLCALDQSIQGPSYLKFYDGYRQHIPRKDAIISVNRDRVQYRLLLYKIIHNLESAFDLKDCTIDFKKIK